MTDDLIKKLEKILTKTILPLKEMQEITKTKVSNIEGRHFLMSHQITSIKDQQSVINEKLDNTATKEDVTRLEEKIEGVLEFAHKIEDERDKNEKRLKKVEAKVGLIN